MKKRTTKKEQEEVSVSDYSVSKARIMEENYFSQLTQDQFYSFDQNSLDGLRDSMDEEAFGRLHSQWLEEWNRRQSVGAEGGLEDNALLDYASDETTEETTEETMDQQAQRYRRQLEVVLSLPRDDSFVGQVWRMALREESVLEQRGILQRLVPLLQSNAPALGKYLTKAYGRTYRKADNAVTVLKKFRELAESA